MEQRVKQAGGTISLPKFQFPGGPRLHFTNPSGNELAVMQLDEIAGIPVETAGLRSREEHLRCTGNSPR